jgi:hypothetical protein
MLEAGIDVSRWDEVLPVVQSVSNNLPGEGALVGYCPNEVIYGQSRLPVDLIVANGKVERLPISQELIRHVEEIRLDLTQIHAEVEERRFSDVVRDQRSKGAVQLPWKVGDTVLVAQESVVNSLVPKWTNPSVIREVRSDWVYVIENILTGIKSEEHVSNLRRCDLSKFKQDLSKWEMVFWSVKNQYGISHIDDFKFVSEGTNKFLLCKITWADARRDPSWEKAAEWIPHLPRYFSMLAATIVDVEQRKHLEAQLLNYYDSVGKW